MDSVTPAKNIPPKKGLTKIQQNYAQSHQTNDDNCPAKEICKSIGNYRQGECFIGTSKIQKCLAGQVFLLGKRLKP